MISLSFLAQGLSRGRGKTFLTSSYRRPQPTSASPSPTGHPELWKQLGPKGTRKSLRCQHASERNRSFHAHSPQVSETFLGETAAWAWLGADTGSQASGEQAARPGRSPQSVPARAACARLRLWPGPEQRTRRFSPCAQRRKTRPPAAPAPRPPAQSFGGQMPSHPRPRKAKLCRRNRGTAETSVFRQPLPVRPGRPDGLSLEGSREGTCPLKETGIS